METLEKGANMFSMKEKQFIAAQIEKLLLELNHPEMPNEKPRFSLHVDGKESWWKAVGTCGTTLKKALENASNP